MNPVLVLQHLNADGPAYLGHWLAREGVPMEVRNTEAGDSYPESIEGYAGLAILGGEMSANDDLPSLRRAEDLFLQAMQRGVPTLGHCLGGQLMARALGARVVVSPAPEVGWHRIELTPHPLARQWLGTQPAAWVYQWHYEASDLPAGAVRLAGNAACPNQAFAIGNHLGMQFHIELDLEKHGRWAQDQGARYLDAMRQFATVHGAARMRADADLRLRAHQALADRIYARWLGHARLFEKTR